MLLADSNVDWGQALPQVKEFAERHKLTNVALDGYDFSDETLFVPNSHAWDCQAPSAADADQWVVVSANMITEAANCTWLIQYQQEQLAGGSMYAFHLPAPIPADGTGGGPPKRADRKKFLGMPFDVKALMLEISRHPERIPEALKAAQNEMSAPRK